MSAVEGNAVMAALLALLLTQVNAPDHSTQVGLNPNDALYASCPVGPPTVEVDEAKVQELPVLAPYLGWLLLHPERASRVACLLETCDDARRSGVKLLEGPKGPMWWGLLVGAVTLGVTVGIGVGWFLPHR